jgi:glucose-1-phosphate thymidylyltransferase
VIDHQNSQQGSAGRRKGILLAAGGGSRLFPMTRAVRKELIPVYDKPMIYYPLSLLMLADIREILLISTRRDLPRFEDLLGDGSQWGLEISYAEQARPEGLAQAFLIAEEFIGDRPICLALGDNLLHGPDLARSLQAATRCTSGATIFGCPSDRPEQFGVIEFDRTGNVRSIEEKPTNPKSEYAVVGLYLFDHRVPKFAAELEPSFRGELEMADLLNLYLARGELGVELLGHDTTWFDTGTPDRLAEASGFVGEMQRRQGSKIACPEEVAYRKGWVTRQQLSILREKCGESDYGDYIGQIGGCGEQAEGSK